MLKYITKRSDNMPESFRIKLEIKQDIYEKLNDTPYDKQFEVFNEILVYYYNEVESLNQMIEEELDKAVDKMPKTNEELDIIDALDMFESNMNSPKINRIKITINAIIDALEEIKEAFGYDAMNKSLKYKSINPIKPPRS